MSRTINPNIQYEKNGKPIVGGKVYYGVANQDPKTNPTPIFSDPNLTVGITNPQILTDQGRLSTPVYVGVSQYSFQVDDALDNQQLADPNLEPLNTVGLVTANIDMNGFKIINAADGTANTDYATFGQNNELYAQVIETIAGSTADALIADLPVAPTTLVNGQQVVVRLANSHASNSTSTPTFKLNNFTAVDITKNNNNTLSDGDTGGGKYYLELTYNSSDNTWHLSNPFNVDKSYSNVIAAKAGSDSVGSFVTTSVNTAGRTDGGALYLVKTAGQAASDGDVIDEFGNHTRTSDTNVLILQPKLSDEIIAPQWGVINSTGTDNANALIAMGAHMRLTPDNVWKIKFGGGVVETTTSRWLVNTKHWWIDGVELGSTSNAGLSRDKIPIDFQGLWDAEPFLSGDNFEEGILFNDASAGDGSIFTTTASDASKISTGEWALVYGWQYQEGGIPSNARYFQWLKVLSVNASTGEVVFDSFTLNDRWDVRWLDFPAASQASISIGKPRILSTVRTTGQGYTAEVVYPVTSILHNVTIANNPNGDVSYGVSGVHVNCKNLIVKTGVAFFGALTSRVCIYDNIEMVDGSYEFDKNTEFATLLNTKVNKGMSTGTGVLQFRAENCDFPASGALNPVSRHHKFINCNLNGQQSNIAANTFGLQTSPFPSINKSTTYENCTFAMIDSIDTLVGSASLTVVSADWTAGSGRLITVASTASNFNFVKRLAEVGGLVFVNPNKNGGTYDIGVIEEVYGSSGDLVIRVAGSRDDSLDDTENFTLHFANPPEFKGCSFIPNVATGIKTTVDDAQLPPPFLYGQKNKKTLMYNPFMRRFDTYAIPMRISEVRFNVINAYPSSAKKIFIKGGLSTSSTDKVTLNTQQTGFRRFNDAESVGIKSGDAVAGNIFTEVSSGITQNFEISAIPSDWYDDGIMPNFLIEVDVVNPI